MAGNYGDTAKGCPGGFVHQDTRFAAVRPTPQSSAPKKGKKKAPGKKGKSAPPSKGGY